MVCITAGYFRSRDQREWVDEPLGLALFLRAECVSSLRFVADALVFEVHTSRVVSGVMSIVCTAWRPDEEPHRLQRWRECGAHIARRFEQYYQWQAELARRRSAHATWSGDNDGEGVAGHDAGEDSDETDRVVCMEGKKQVLEVAEYLSQLLHKSLLASGDDGGADVTPAFEGETKAEQRKRVLKARLKDLVKQVESRVATEPPSSSPSSSSSASSSAADQHQQQQPASSSGNAAAASSSGGGGTGLAADGPHGGLTANGGAIPREFAVPTGWPFLPLRSPAGFAVADGLNVVTSLDGAGAQGGGPMTPAQHHQALRLAATGTSFFHSGPASPKAAQLLPASQQQQQRQPMSGSAVTSEAITSSLGSQLRAANSAAATVTASGSTSPSAQHARGAAAGTGYASSAAAAVTHSNSSSGDSGHGFVSDAKSTTHSQSEYSRSGSGSSSGAQQSPLRLSATASSVAAAGAAFISSAGGAPSSGSVSDAFTGRPFADAGQQQHQQLRLSSSSGGGGSGSNASSRRVQPQVSQQGGRQDTLSRTGSGPSGDGGGASPVLTVSAAQFQQKQPLTSPSAVTAPTGLPLAGNNATTVQRAESALPPPSTLTLSDVLQRLPDSERHAMTSWLHAQQAGQSQLQLQQRSQQSPSVNHAQSQQTAASSIAGGAPNIENLQQAATATSTAYSAHPQIDNQLPQQQVLTQQHQQQAALRNRSSHQGGPATAVAHSGGTSVDINASAQGTIATGGGRVFLQASQETATASAGHPRPISPSYSAHQQLHQAQHHYAQQPQQQQQLLRVTSYVNVGSNNNHHDTVSRQGSLQGSNSSVSPSMSQYGGSNSSAASSSHSRSFGGVQPQPAKQTSRSLVGTLLSSFGRHMASSSSHNGSATSLQAAVQSAAPSSAVSATASVTSAHSSASSPVGSQQRGHAAPSPSLHQQQQAFIAGGSSVGSGGSAGVYPHQQQLLYQPQLHQSRSSLQRQLEEVDASYAAAAVVAAAASVQHDLDVSSAVVSGHYMHGSYYSVPPAVAHSAAAATSGSSGTGVLRGGGGSRGRGYSSASLRSGSPRHESALVAAATSGEAASHEGQSNLSGSPASAPAVTKSGSQPRPGFIGPFYL